MRKIRLSAGTIEYEDTGGSGPVLVLLHGLAQNGSVWRRVVAELRPNHRCVVPTLPLGGHRRPMRTDTDLSMHGISRLVAEFMERLDLRAVDKRDTLQVAERLRSFERPALVVWAAEDRVMLPEHGRRLAKLLPRGRLIEIDDSYTLIPEDRPAELSRVIQDFVRDTL